MTACLQLARCKHVLRSVPFHGEVVVAVNGVADIEPLCSSEIVMFVAFSDGSASAPSSIVKMMRQLATTARLTTSRTKTLLLGASPATAFMLTLVRRPSTPYVIVHVSFLSALLSVMVSQPTLALISHFSSCLQAGREHKFVTGFTVNRLRNTLWCKPCCKAAALSPCSGSLPMVTRKATLML